MWIYAIISSYFVSRLKVSTGAKENEEIGKYVLIDKSKYAGRSYGLTQSLLYAVVRISTEKTKVNTNQELRRNTVHSLRRNNLMS